MTEPTSRPDAPAEPIDPKEKTPLPMGRLLLGVAAAAVGLGGGTVLWHSDLRAVYASLLFFLALIALIDIAIVIRRTARGEPTVIDDDGPTLVDDPRDP